MMTRKDFVETGKYTLEVKMSFNGDSIFPTVRLVGVNEQLSSSGGYSGEGYAAEMKAQLNRIFMDDETDVPFHMDIPDGVMDKGKYFLYEYEVYLERVRKFPEIYLSQIERVVEDLQISAMEDLSSM